jgi:hypothetical protein
MLMNNALDLIIRRVLVDVVHPLGVEAAGAALDAVDDVPFFEQKLGEVRAVLAGDAGDEGDFLWQRHIKIQVY